MHLFEITLPRKDNAGKNTNAAHGAFKASALSLAGGFTDLGMVDGVWKGDDGRVYTDQSSVYRIACTPTVWRKVVSRAFELFPDQEALFWVELGEAHIEGHPR